MVYVQAILFASLAVSLLSAFLAMLGKQWLNRYASADMRGSAVERCQNRQRKLDGIVAWYFDYVMEALPLMLQAALLLLGCALSRYLWDISIAVASVVVGVTLSGAVSYFFIIVAGAVSENCPYQTPGSRILRYLGPKFWRKFNSAPSAINSSFSIIRAALPSVVSVRHVIKSIFVNALSQSRVIKIVVVNADLHYPWWSRREITPFFGKLFLKVPLGFAIDVYHLGRAVIRMLSPLPLGAYLLVRRANRRLCNMYSTSLQRFGQQISPSGLRCISWTLQTSLDKSIHLTASEHLATMTEFTGLDWSLAMDCFNVFVSCVSISDDKLVVMQGLEQLATVSAGCFFRALHHLSATDSTSRFLVDLRRRYIRAFPFETDFGGLPFCHNIMVIHALVHQCWDRCNSQWEDYRPSGQEHVPFARHMVEVAQAEYQRVRDLWPVREGLQLWRRKVPRWILRFALHSLSLDPSPPESVVADCLTIVSIDLGCDVSDIVALDEKYVKI